MYKLIFYLIGNQCIQNRILDTLQNQNDILKTVFVPKASTSTTDENPTTYFLVNSNSSMNSQVPLSTPVLEFINPDGMIETVNGSTLPIQQEQNNHDSTQPVRILSINLFIFFQ